MQIVIDELIEESLEEFSERFLNISLMKSIEACLVFFFSWNLRRNPEAFRRK